MQTGAPFRPGDELVDAKGGDARADAGHAAPSDGAAIEGEAPARPWSIETEALTKSYGQIVAVDHLDLRVQAGEIFGFLGPNGAGKTTTIRMLVGLVRPTSGTVRVAGLELATAAVEARSRIAYVPDTPYLYDKLTAREFIHFVAGLYRVAPDLAARRIAELLGLFGLDERADDLLDGFSHGMRQKVLLAAALVHDPEVLFLDEPSVGLDPRSARLLRDIMRQLADRGSTVFLSTHILEIAERMCDRIGIIDGGRLIALGTVDDLHRQARTVGTLEDIFLNLTGGPAYTEIAEVLD